MYCYIKVSLHFLNVDSLEWVERRFMVYADASGEFDYGNIESFVGCDDGYELIGDWGKSSGQRAGCRSNCRRLVVEKKSDSQFPLSLSKPKF